ncbi:MAG: TonB-dependent receptor [Candidatus Cloacimonetes bacterium]|nr:TonB-dependent receptor [Candidatus Cloacimonadota bacterium]
MRHNTRLRSSLWGVATRIMPPGISCGPGIMLIALLMISGLPLFARQIEIRILNTDLEPLANVRVLDSDSVKHSDEEGLVQLHVDGAQKQFSLLGYEDQRLTLSQIMDLQVIMQRKELHYPTIRVRELEYRNPIPALDAKLIHPDTNSAAGSTSDLLLTSSSFSSSDTRLMGEAQTISLLGSFSRHTLVMLDGVALNAAGEAFDFSKIPISQIERIEIVKGNASAYGGSAAVGGIVNIVSKSPVRAHSLDLGVKGTFGSFDLQRQQYQLSLQRAAWAFTLDYDHYYARNDFSYNAWWDPDTSYRRNHNAKKADNIFFKGTYEQGRSRFEYSLNQGSFIRQLPGPINFTDIYDDSRMSGSHWYHHGAYTIQGDQVMGEVKVFHHSDGSAFRNLASSNPIYQSHYAQRQTNYGGQVRTTFYYRQSHLEGVTEYKTMDYRFIQHDQHSEVRGSRDNLAVGLRAAQKYAIHIVNADTRLSLRRDWAEDTAHDTWRMEHGFSYESEVKYSLSGSLGTGFSLPSLYDMYWIGDSETQGNPDLKSEKSWGYHVNAGLEHPGWKLSAAYYNSEIEDLIQWRQIFLFGSKWKPFNVGKAKIRNYEVEAFWQPHRLLSMKGGVTFTEAKDYSRAADGSPSASYGKFLSYTPKQKAQIALKIADEQRACTLSWSYTGEQFSTADNLIDPLPGFSNLDLDLLRKFRIADWELGVQAGLSNLLNERYEIYAYIPQPGFNWSLKLSLNYNI